MARHPLPLGQAGKIYFTPTLDNAARHPRGGWRARCKFRLLSGKLINPERTGKTKGQAERRLKAALADMPADASGRERIDTLAERWQRQLRAQVARGALSQTTADRYATRLNKWILPRLGQLRAVELEGSPRALSGFLADVSAATGQSNAQGIRSTLSGLIGYAVAQGAMRRNPLNDLPAERASRSTDTRARDTLSAADVQKLLAKLDTSDLARRHDLPDLVRVLAGTGARIGEALGLLWSDLDLAADQPTVRISRNVVRTSTGLRANPGKTSTSRRTVALPRWCASVLADRLAKRGGDGDGPVFPSGEGGWREPANLYHRAWSKVRADAGYPLVTFREFRRSVATTLDQGGLTPREIADTLGHAQPSMTLNVYMGRGVVSGRSAAALDAAMPSRGIPEG